MLIEFGGHRDHYGRHAGMHRALESGALTKVLIILIAFVLAIVARYVTTQWAEKTYGDLPRANLIGWLAFFAVLIVVGVGGLKIA
jgi:uncharacterized membrane protein YidH (DUF202 family)